MQLILQGALVGGESLTNFTFRADRPYAGCLICGKIFQSELGRSGQDDSELRQLWRIVHAKSHTEAEHRELRYYQEHGYWSTPQAAKELAPFGVVSLSDIVLSPEHAHAGMVAGRVPDDDCVSTIKR